MLPLFNFTRSDEDIRQDLLQVFNSGSGTAKEQWCLHAESVVEPVGWNAFWKLSKIFCKKFEVRYPCVVHVLVKLINFEDLTTIVEVLSVQHETVSLPECITGVPLIELWPTMNPGEQTVSATSTAKCIDLMRFFYEYLWMPWDEQDGKVLLSNTVEDRINLWMEMKNGTIPKYIARMITLLRNSAIHAYEKLQELDSSLNEEDLTDDDDSLLSPSNITHCAELNAKLDGLMSKWTLYENPVIRKEYLDRIKKKYHRDDSKNNVVALWQGGYVKEFSNLSRYLEGHLTNDQKITITTSAEEALSQEPSEVVIFSSQYELPEISLSHISLHSISGSTLKASDMRSCLLMLSDECRLENLKLYCSTVNTVIVILDGFISIRNCMFLDDTEDIQSQFAQGIVAKPGSRIKLEGCSFENFYSGIVVHSGVQMVLRNCSIKRCGVGIQMYSGAQVSMDGVVIDDCTEQCIRCEMEDGSVETEMEGLEMKNCRIGKME